MTFSKIAFAVASFGAEVVAFNQGDKCTITPGSKDPVNPQCSSHDMQKATGMTCKPDPKNPADYDKQRQPIAGTCQCATEDLEFVDGRCQGKEEQKINKCHAAGDGNKCHWEDADGTGKCVLNSAVKNDCNKCTPPAHAPTWAHCYGSWTAGGKFEGCVTQATGSTEKCTCDSVDDPCSKLNTDDSTVDNASSVVMV